MADTKISALTSATTPLAGTEVIPLVQSSTTKKVAVSDLTAGRAVSALSINSALIGAATGSPLSLQSNGSVQATLDTTGYLGIGLSSPAGALHIYKANPTLYVQDSSIGVSVGISANSFAANTAAINVYNNYPLVFGVNNAEVARFDTSGNLVPKTAAKGINFTANTPASGMTSQLLNWYEEGTWTPTVGDGTVVGAFSSSGTYTRIGRFVTCTAILNGATSIQYTAGQHFSGLPFGVNKYAVGIGTNSAGNQTVAFLCYTDGNVYASGTLGPNASLTVTFSYTVA